MQKKTIALFLALAMMLGAATVALAADTTTDGSIKFKEGDVIILPPPGPVDPEDPCCPCYGQEPGEGCDCPCHDYDKYDDPRDDSDFKDFDLGGNLYFGEWTIGAFGDFISNDPEFNDTGKNEFTGIYVINQTPNVAKISVKVSEFKYNATDKLTGAELTLKNEKIASGAGYDLIGTEHKEVLLLAPNDTSYNILTVPAGARIKASWFGSLYVPVGSAIYAGTAQAVLTWEDLTATP